MTLMQRCAVQMVITAIFAAVAIVAMVYSWPWVVAATLLLIFLVLSGPRFD